VLPILGRIAPPVRDTSVPAPNAIQELREGLAAVWNIRWLRITIPLASVSNMFLFSITEISTPFFVKDSLHADSVAFGLMVASISVGAIIGAAGMGSVRKLRRRGLLAYGCWISSCLLIGSIGLSQTVVMACLISVGAGMASAAGQLIWANVLQELVPANLLGRVSSVEQLGSTGLVPLGLGLVGWATGQFGAAAVFILGGLLAAGAFSFGLFSNAVRGLE
jgi:DHA3 family tetracycline resistance protein-like MFS transporter